MAAVPLAMRLLAFNRSWVFVPVRRAVLYLDVYETHLRDAQELAMVQQARVLAAAIGDEAVLNGDAIFERLLVRLERRNDARFRVYDAHGALLADSARIGPAAIPDADQYSTTARSGSVRRRILYRIGAWIATVNDRFASLAASWLAGRSRGDAPASQAEGSAAVVQAALAARYGARRSDVGQRVRAVVQRRDGTPDGALSASAGVSVTLRICARCKTSGCAVSDCDRLAGGGRLLTGLAR